MRIRIQRRGLVTAVVVAVVGTVLLYLASTRGVAAWNTSRADPVAGAGGLPAVVENAPSSVSTTADYGPPGGVAMVFAGTEVRDGLLGEVEHPWITVTSHGADYRALIAPDLPAAGPAVMAASHDGNRLAWPTDSGLDIYDTVTGRTRELAIDGIAQVGAFAPDSSMVLTYGDQLTAVDVDTGDIVAAVAADPTAVARAAWRPDSSAFDFVTDGELTTVAVAGGVESSQPTEIPERASLAWAATGDRLASLRVNDGVKRLFVSRLGEDGTIARGEQVDTQGISIQRLIGFSGERTIAVVAFLLESGSVERILDIPLDGRSPTDLTTLPPPGDNWVGSTTLAIAADNLVAGSTAADDHIWPWTYSARLVACILLSGFLLGLYVTRRRRT